MGAVCEFVEFEIVFVDCDLHYFTVVFVVHEEGDDGLTVEE